MNDFDYDVMQKKRTARGAFNKKGGSKSKKCTLPSDYLTPAQKKALNGPVNTVCLNHPMDWRTFKGLSDSLKVEYIKYIQKNYSANWTMMGQMMKISDVLVCKEGKRLGVKALPIVYDKKRRLEIAAVWEEFCNGPEQPVMELEKKDEPQVTNWIEMDGEQAEKFADALESAKSIADVEQALIDMEARHEVPYSARPKEEPPEEQHMEYKPVPESHEPESNTKRLDMTFDGWPDDVTMLILRNLLRGDNVKVRISAEMI